MKRGECCHANRHLASRVLQARTDILWGLSYAAEIDPEGAEEVARVTDLAVVTALASDADADSKLRTPAMRLLGNLVSCPEHITQAVVDAGGVDAFYGVALNKDEKKSLKKEALWVSLPSVSPRVCALTVYVTGALERRCWNQGAEHGRRTAPSDAGEMRPGGALLALISPTHSLSCLLAGSLLSHSLAAKRLAQGGSVDRGQRMPVQGHANCRCEAEARKGTMVTLC